MANRRFAHSLILVFGIVSLMIVSGCSSQPNPELNLGGIDVEEAFQGMILRVHQIVGGVNSLETADKAVPELESVSLTFDDLLFNSQKMSPEGQTALSVLALKAAPQMDALITQVKRSPAIEKRLGQPLNEILGKLMKLI